MMTKIIFHKKLLTYNDLKFHKGFDSDFKFFCFKE
ncbi:hypothetical protein MNBD_NITROSPINAE01-1639 [hydrothermal vent metagenome]|uniref:Uncharacterized protein n=1 Tax=hydrothermal vent metagenome TaxID=652676 RepID=A0A3B1CDY6_9ZZZZ